jgi:CheY-specific phosphatase CheX
METDLFQAAARTFEELAFMFTDSELNEQQSEAEYEAGAELAFSGPVEGKLLLQMYGKVLVLLTRNLLAEEVKLEESLLEDSLKEVTNIICGNLLPNIAGSEAVFDISAPRLLSDEYKPDTAESPTARSVVGLESGRAEIFLFLEKKQL